MKKLFLFGALFSSYFCYSQNTYQVISVGTKYTTTQIESALNAADLCGFYYTDHNRVIQFDDGSIVHLKQQAELPGLNTSCFIPYNSAQDSEYWEISTNGHLIRRIQTLGK